MMRDGWYKALFVVDAGSSYPVLSDLHFAVAGTLLPVYAYVFRICPSGHPEARPAEGTLSGREAYLALPSLGGQRV
jgi:hypothetical protein